MRTTAKRRVWAYNIMEHPYITFWDFWSLIEEEEKIKFAYREAMSFALISHNVYKYDVFDKIVSAFIYESWDKDRKLDTVQIKEAVKECVGGYNNELWVRQFDALIWRCLSILEDELHARDYRQISKYVKEGVGLE